MDSYKDELEEQIISLREENQWLNDELRRLFNDNRYLLLKIQKLKKQQKLKKPQKKVSFGENKIFVIPNRQEFLRQRENHPRKTVFRNNTKPKGELKNQLKCEKIVCLGDCGVIIHDKNQIPCSFLKTNQCMKGDNCEYSHLCVAKFNGQNCRFGGQCHFDH